MCYAKHITSTNSKVAAVKNFKAITSPELYDKDIRPYLGENTTVKVGVTMYVVDYEFDANDRKMDVVMYFRQKWTDPRLEATGFTESVIGGKSLVDRVWLPDTFFANSLDVEVVKDPIRNTFISIKPNGDVLFSERVKISFRCGPKKSSNPDECALEMESYGHSMADIEYIWGKGAESVGYSKSFEHGDYKLVEAVNSVETVTLSSGQYSRIMAAFKFNPKN
jgi:hypothetical protein